MGLAPSSGGTFSLLYGVAKNEGFGGLFRSSSIVWVPGGARMLYFTTYEHVARLLGNVTPHHHWIQLLMASSNTLESSGVVQGVSHLESTHVPTDTTGTSPYPAWVYGTAGGISTIASQLIMAPYSVISSRLQIATGPTRLSAIAVLRDVASRPRGIRALWTGYSSAIAQLGPQHATMWAVSSWLQDQLVNPAWDGGDARCEETGEESSELHPISSGECTLGLLPRLGTSMCGSFIAIVVTSPIDAVRTHRQIMISHPQSNVIASGSGTFFGGGGGGGGRIIILPSSWSIFVKLYQQQGLRAFTNGIVPRAMANCPGMIAMMVGYQYVKQLAVHVQRRQQQQHVDD